MAVCERKYWCRTPETTAYCFLKGRLDDCFACRVTAGRWRVSEKKVLEVFTIRNDFAILLLTTIRFLPKAIGVILYAERNACLVCVHVRSRLAAVYFDQGWYYYVIEIFKVISFCLLMLRYVGHTNLSVPRCFNLISWVSAMSNGQWPVLYLIPLPELQNPQNLKVKVDAERIMVELYGSLKLNGAVTTRTWVNTMFHCVSSGLSLPLCYDGSTKQHFSAIENCKMQNFIVNYVPWCVTIILFRSYWFPVVLW